MHTRPKALVDFASSFGLETKAAQHHLSRTAHMQQPHMKTQCKLMKVREAMCRCQGLTATATGGHDFLYSAASLSHNHGGPHEYWICPHCADD
ncbi:hypothetical protein WJX77_009446 [Trebouxia sp. C0004]